MNPQVLDSGIVATMLDHSLTTLECHSFQEVLPVLRLAVTACRQALPLLNDADAQRLQRAGLLAHLDAAQTWIDNPNTNFHQHHRYGAALELLGTFFPRTTSIRSVHGNAACDAIVELVHACEQ